MIVHFCLSLIFWVKYCHIRNLKTKERLCLLINMMLIIMFVLTYACFPIFLSAYCNIMLATIKLTKREKIEIKLYFTLK